jgi:cell wall-associated NlpC family hydrolase
MSLTLPLLTEAEKRAAVIEEARSWIGTPYFWLADKKGVGVDCAMLLVRCFIDTGILPEFDPRPYSPHWHLHQTEEKYLAWLNTYGSEKAEDKATPGDVYVWKFGRCFSHSGLYIGNGEIIHAYASNGRVMRGRLSDTMLRYNKNGTPRPRKLFDVWESR